MSTCPAQLLGQTLVNVDIDHLDSLDPELYKNLLYLKVGQAIIITHQELKHFFKNTMFTSYF